MSKEKYNQLINEGFCIVENILSDTLLDRLRSVTDRLCENMTEEHKRYFRSQGSAFRTYEDPVFAELISWQLSLDALKSMGFEDSTFTSGYILSKPPHSPPLFWHYDWFGWADPSTYDPRPQQVFFMYYLTDTTPHNGCLRAIPGSHYKHNPLHDLIVEPHAGEISAAKNLNRPEFSMRPDEIDVPVKAGDLLIGDSRLLHASYANNSDERRTVITLWFQPDFCDLPERIKAQLASKTHPIPEDWSPEAQEMVRRLNPKYDGDAEPYGRILYQREQD